MDYTNMMTFRYAFRIFHRRRRRRRPPQKWIGNKSLRTYRIYLSIYHLSSSYVSSSYPPLSLYLLFARKNVLLYVFYLMI